MLFLTHFKPNGISHSYQFDKANSGHPDQTPCLESDLGLHCFHMSHKKAARLIWVNFCL